MSGLVYDKKQLPQIIGLGVVSAGLLGYFGFKMFTPPPTRAAGVVTPTANASADGSASDAADATSDSDASAPNASALIGASAPTDAMRDPFATPDGLAAPVVTAPPKPARAAIPGLPSLGQVMPLPVPGAAARVQAGPTAWAVTGVICSDGDPGASLAIFRSGDERRYVRLGSMVDDNTRLIGIDRAGVTVSRGNDHIRLGLGAPKTPPPAGQAAVGSPNGPALSPGSVIQAAPAANAGDPLPALAAPTAAQTMPALPPIPTEVMKPAPPPGSVPTF